MTNEAPWADFQMPLAAPTDVTRQFSKDQLIAMVRAVAQKRHNDTELATLFDVEQMVRTVFDASWIPFAS